jgi:hypothetical protein
MRRTSLSLLVVLVAVVVSAGCRRAASTSDSSPADPAPNGPTKPDQAIGTQITLDKLRGNWKGTFENGSVSLTFFPEADRKPGIPPAAGITIKIGGGATTSAVRYEIDSKKNEVRFGFEKDAVAKPTEGGALLLSGQFNLGGKTYTMPETKIERVKSSEPEK